MRGSKRTKLPVRAFFNAMKNTDTAIRVATRGRELREAFPEVYREFFSKVDIVCSASHHFFWSGEFISMFGGPSVLQKLPTRVYVGLQFIDKPTIKFGSYLTYKPLQGHFAVEKHDTYVIKRLVPWLREKYGKKDGGIVVHILSEMPPAIGVNSSGATAAALSAALLLWHGKIKHQQVDEWQKIKTMKKLCGDSKTGFDVIARLAWQIEAIFHSDSASGAGWAGAMVSSQFPIMYMAEYRIGDKTDYGHGRFPLMTAGDMEMYQKMNFWIYRLEEIFKPEVFTFPLDYCLVYTGYSNTVASIKATNKSIANKLKAKASFIQELMKDFKPSKNYWDKSYDGKKPMLVDDIHFWGWEWMWEWEALGPLTLASFTTLQLLRKIYADEYDMSDVEEFLRNVNKGYNVLRMSEGVMPNRADLIPVIKSYFRKYQPDIVYGVKPIEVGGGKGDMLVALPAGELRNREHKLIDYLKKETGNDRITLDYANWLDGYGTDGLEVDQVVADGVLSEFIGKGSLRIQCWDTELVKTTTILPPKQLSRLMENGNLVIDKINQEIMIGDKPTTSKDLPTVKTTIEIMERLLMTEAKALSNADMPASSYATSRNDLQSKIVAPLTKLVKKRTGKEIKLMVRGNTADYQLILAGSQVPIYLIDKVF